jgi:hypothetical protein
MVVSVNLLCSLWVKRALKLFSSRSNVVVVTGMLADDVSGADGIATTRQVSRMELVVLDGSARLD